MLGAFVHDCYDSVAKVSVEQNAALFPKLREAKGEETLASGNARLSETETERASSDSNSGDVSSARQQRDICTGLCLSELALVAKKRLSRSGWVLSKKQARTLILRTSLTMAM